MKFLRRLIMPAVLFLAWLGLAGQAQDQARQPHVGRVQDWSYRHVVLSGGLPAADLGRAKAEPRILSRLAERNLHRASARTAMGRFEKGDRGTTRPPRSRTRGLKIDWSVPLGAGIVAPYMFPAKYSFDINATPSCANDYVVFGLNVAGATPGQANLVGVNNLYSGAAPRLCLANPTVNWAYNGSTAGGSVLTSPVISLDGQRIAYVESAAGTAIFHVLAWKSGEGTAATVAATPTLNGSCTGTVAIPTSSCLKSVTFSTTATDTLSSPWVDYTTDKAFVGGDDGKIYRISCVFNCALNTNPTVDWTFTLPVAGTGGAAATPNGPVYDSSTGRLIVADQLGELWTINASGATPSLFAGPVMIGGGGCTIAHPPGRTGTASGANCTGTGGSYGIPDSVILDGSLGKVFAFTGNDGTAGASAVVAQLNENLTGLVRVHVGLGSVGATIANWNVHSGAFDDTYFDATPSNGHLFMCGTAAGSTNPTHYWIGFTAYPTMNATPDGSLLRLAAANLPCAPYTELFNPSITLSGGAGHHDLLVSGLVGAAANGFVLTNDISTGAIITGQATSVNYPGGVSGIIIDNVSASGQASSVYFSTQGIVNVGSCANARCAVKLTQLGLQ
ncbi:MAG: hypothetical protein ACXVZH_11855 [Terriglobales bacterium]